MANESFVYSFVARGTVILAEHTTNSSNILPSIAAQWLDSLPAGPHKKFSLNYNEYNFNFLVETGYVYGVVAEKSVGRQILFELLERIRKDFVTRYGHGKGDAAGAKSLSKRFGPVMKQHIKYVADHAEEIDKLAKVQTQVSEVQLILLDNINKVMERRQPINSVEDKAKQLHEESRRYNQTATEVRREMWFQNMKIKIVILVILVLLALIIWVFVCDGFDCAK